MRTTDFRKRVWEIMLTIPFGKTMTYGEIAKQIAAQNSKIVNRPIVNGMSAQAVGGGT